MKFTNRDKEGFSLGTKGGVKLIVVREVRKITALGDLCDNIGEDDVVEERVPRERHTIKAASSSFLFFFVEFVESSIHCGVEVLHGESGIMERGADGIPQVRISHKVLTSFLTFVNYIITFFLSNVKGEKFAGEGTKHRAI
nr:MAG TPA: hypothetical protein [Caudoviricetes sp.]